MKNSIIYISLLSSLALFGSCNKQLSQLPSDAIPIDKALTSMADLQAGLYGIYAANGSGAINGIYIGSLLADEVKVSAGNRGQGLQVFKWLYTGVPSEANSDFASYYSMIDAINRILGVIDGIPAKNDNDVAIRKRIKAELTALRGIAHFEALIRFMRPGYDPDSLGVPIMLKADLYGQPARAKTGDVITQIKADLNVGRNEPTIPNAPDNIVRLSQATIAAYQARVGLLSRNWADVVTYAKQAIQLSGAQLATGNDFLDYWGDANEYESLWNFHNNAEPQLFWFDTNGDIFFEPSDKLIGEYDQANDIRFQAYFQLPYIAKYPGSQIGPQTNDLKLVRVAELYLDLAEAYARQNDLGNAATYLNDLRDARIAGYVHISFSSQPDAINQVMDERYKEFCYEGFRFFDLKRSALPIVRDASDVQSSEWQTMQANDHRFALPIPQHEVFANKNMVQNAGY